MEAGAAWGRMAPRANRQTS